MSFLYHTFIYDPILNLLVFLYQTLAFHDLGVAIIIATLIVRTILFPLFQKSAHHQTVIQAIQPKIKKIQDDHKGDKEKEVQALLALYKEHQVNPFSGFLLLFLQLPVLIALYQIFLHSLSIESLTGLYSFVAPPASLNTTLLGLIDLSKPSILMVCAAALMQFIHGRATIAAQQSVDASSPAARMGRQMTYIAPVITIVIFINFPAAVGLYWFTSSLYSVVQQGIINAQIRNGTLGNIHPKTS